MRKLTKLTKIKLENFTAFKEADIELSEGINIFIGANGTGKTHLLKLLYAATAITLGEDCERGFAQKILGVFKPHGNRMTRLMYRQQGFRFQRAKVEVQREDGAKLTASISSRKSKAQDVRVTGETNWKRGTKIESVYIPVKEMLAHAPGLLATMKRREIAFEETYQDIITKAFLLRLKGPKSSTHKRLLKTLQTTVEGKIFSEGEYFFLRGSQGDLEFTLLAEGTRKLALIWLLIQNGTLKEDSVLFWDEPESNLNPKLMGNVIEFILELQRIGVQVFLATHNYVILKEFDLRCKKEDQIRYISLYHDERDTNDELKILRAHISDSYSGIDPNLIAETFSDLYDRELDRSLKDLKI